MKSLTTRQRVERMVDHYFPLAYSLERKKMVKMLQGEHRRLRAQVRKLSGKMAASKFINNDEILAYRMACDDILKALR